MLSTKNIVRSLVGLSVAAGWASAQDACCPNASIVHAKLSASPTWGRRLLTDDTCVASRATHITTWPVVTDQWVTKGGVEFIETDMTRYARDFGLNAEYWKDADGGAIAKGAKVVVLEADISPAFVVSTWPSDNAVGTAGEYCAADLVWTAKDLGEGLANGAAYFIILAPTGTVLDHWLEWATAWGSLEGSICGGSGCRVAVQENTGAFTTDVLAGLVAIAAPGTPFADCAVCEYVAPTTTAAPSGAAQVGTGVAATIGLAALALNM